MAVGLVPRRALRVRPRALRESRHARGAGCTCSADDDDASANLGCGRTGERSIERRSEKTSWWGLARSGLSPPTDSRGLRHHLPHRRRSSHRYDRLRRRRVRRLRFGEQVTISEDDAVAIAREVAETRGWSWRGRVVVNRRRKWIFFGELSFEVFSNADYRGGNVIVAVDAKTGEVLRAGFGRR